MSTIKRAAAVTVPALALGLLVGCANASGGTTSAEPSTMSTPTPATTAGTAGPDGGVETSRPPQPGATKTTTKPPATTEDCVSYNPNALTVRYEAGVYVVSDGSRAVLRLSGGPGENTGAKGLALAQRYRKHCYLGRDNAREDANAYVFDYWLSPSGMTPAIPDQEEDCSPYDRTNLTVEDMGGTDGWRVKDHDHVLHLFDNERDARSGKQVLARYGQICFLGDQGDGNGEVVDYLI